MPARLDVALIDMPFGTLYRPSIGLSLLRAELEQAGRSARLFYLTIPFAERIGSELYVRLSNQEPRPSDLVGEWVFSGALHGSAGDPAVFIDRILRDRSAYGRDPTERTPVTEEFIARVVAAREIAESFIEECAERVLEWTPQIVGFTSVFQQHVASLALARRLKQARPECQVIFGGHNCEGVMGAELVRQFEWVDAAVAGEAEVVLPEIVRRTLEGEALEGISGVYTRSNVASAFAVSSFPRAAPVEEMDRLPEVDYDDFFAAHRASALSPDYERQVLFESSRGCWWGERSHCTFCGLNPDSLPYRSKSPRRAFDELTRLTSRYPGCPVTAVDTILDLRYFREFFPELEARKLRVGLFYETKSNLRKEQVRQMSAAGVTSVQPGIESLSTAVLKRMGKGVRMLQNVQVLKWFKEHGIRPYWNLLWGFPGEEPQEYARMGELIPLLTHLPRPDSAGKIRLDRFSPNFQRAQELGLVDVEPYPAYAHVYAGVAPEHVRNLAYYFRFRYGEPVEAEEYTRPAWEAVQRWWQCAESSDLFSAASGERLLIWDFRPIAREPLTVLDGPERTLYVACDSIHSVARLSALLSAQFGFAVGCEDVEALLAPLFDRGLMIREGDGCLSLAVPLGSYSPSAAVLARFCALLSHFGIDGDGHVQIPLSPRESGASLVVTLQSPASGVPA